MLEYCRCLALALALLPLYMYKGELWRWNWDWDWNWNWSCGEDNGSLRLLLRLHEVPRTGNVKGIKGKSHGRIAMVGGWVPGRGKGR